MKTVLQSLKKLLKTNRFPISNQFDSFDCGPTCLESILRYYGKPSTRQYLRQLCQQDRQGSSLAGIAHAAESLGFRTLSVKVSFDELRDKTPLPCIAYYPHGHFVIIHKLKKKRVYVADPAIGLCSYSKEEFEAFWLIDAPRHNWGILLLLEPTDQLMQSSGGTIPPSKVSDFWRPLWRDSKRTAVPIGIALLVSLFIQLVLPFLSAGVVDLGIANSNLKFVYVIAIAELVLVLSRLLVQLLQSWIITYVGLRIDVKMLAQFLRKLTRLPLSFFDGKLIGDLLQRIADLKSLQQFLTNNLWQVGLSVMSLIIFGTVLALFKPVLIGIFAIGTMAYVAYSAMFIKQQRLYSYKGFILSARKQGLIYEFLSGMQEIKLNNAEDQRRWQWEVAEHSIAKNQLKASLLGHFQAVGGSMIIEFQNQLLTVLVARDVIAGNMTLGTMIAVQYLIGQLNWPLGQIVNLLVQGHEALLSYQRAKEIFSQKDEDQGNATSDFDGFGDIEFKDVSFAYGGTASNFLFQNLNLRIPSGKTTAIVGRSGSGKTTLLKLILRFYSPDDGEIALAGLNINSISHRQWRQACGIVMQDGYIFSDTIVNNIAVAEDLIDLNRVNEVARIAQIDTFIESLPLGYETKIGNDGIGISRGQAQRILIARALYKDPSFMFFDEATSALDAETEGLLVNELHRFMAGKTAVIIAHRMSTVKRADQIILLDRGKVMEVGTHDQLISKRGRYFDLVKNQLDLV